MKVPEAQPAVRGALGLVPCTGASAAYTPLSAVAGAGAGAATATAVARA